MKGVERTVVHQLVRSPGAYYTETNKRQTGLLPKTGTVLPQTGAWLDIVTATKTGALQFKINRRRVINGAAFLKAYGLAENNEQLLQMFNHHPGIVAAVEQDTTHDQQTAIEHISDHPGFLGKLETPGPGGLLGENHNMGPAGRYKLNEKLGTNKTTEKFTPEDLTAAIRYYLAFVAGTGNYTTPTGTEMTVEADQIDHLGNRIVRSVGEQLHNSFNRGLAQTLRVASERIQIGRTKNITPRKLLNMRPLISELNSFFVSSSLSQFCAQVNPLDNLTHRRRLTSLGRGALKRETASPKTRDVHPSHYGRICPVETPEGAGIGVITSLSAYAAVGEHGFLTTPYRKVENGEVTTRIEHLTALQEEKVKIAQANAELDENNRFVKPQVLSRWKGQPHIVNSDEVEYMDVSPKQLVSVSAGLIPFLEHDDANRALMGANMQRQALPLIQTEKPLVGTGMEQKAAQDSGTTLTATDTGTVLRVDGDSIRVKYDNQGTIRHELTKYARSNNDTPINQKPHVTTGTKVKPGDLLADGSATSEGELALGKNLLCAFMPWKGYNFEDAIVISEKLVKNDTLTSLQIKKYETKACATKLGDEEITRDIPDVPENVLAGLDETGIVRIGATVQAGDYLVGKVTPRGEETLTPDERLLHAIFGEKSKEVANTSKKVKHGEGGVVIDVQVFSKDDPRIELPPTVNHLVRILIASKHKIASGDKLAGRHGNKGVIAKVLPEEDMPFMADGTPIDIVLSPLGVPSRMNPGQILETHLGWVTSQGWDTTHPLLGTGNPGTPVATPVFDSLSEQELETLLTNTRPDRDGNQLIGQDGKTILYDGQTGEPFEDPITVGYMYILKLDHIVNNKLHMRSTGPYSKVTQQPLGGRSHRGGQRFGEMEVWALEAHGAAHTLREFLTTKSDDVTGRAAAYEAILKGENLPEPGVPESFKVLVRELQGLGFQVETLQNGEVVTLTTRPQPAQMSVFDKKQNSEGWATTWTPSKQT